MDESSTEEGEIIKIPTIPLKINEWKEPFLKVIGEGTFGTVYLSVKNGKFFALKSLNYDDTHKNGLPLTIYRELRIIRSLDHKNILKLIGIVTQGFKKENFDRKNVKIFFVFDFYECDLNKLIRKKELSLNEIKYIFKQMVDGLLYLKSKNILHRDLKTANILVNNDLEIKIADFGLSKYKNNDFNTPGVVTLWYRAPEILLGSTEYGFSADIWSLGCILAEMFKKKPFFQGNCVFTQLESIIYALGSINDKSIEEVDKLPEYNKIKLPQSINHMDELISDFDKEAKILLQKILVLDPKKRISIEEIKESSFYKEDL